MTRAIDVAGYIKRTLDLSSQESFKLQKLVYFAQAWHLAWTGKPIFNESFEAWPNGPVARSVFRDNRYFSLPESTVLDDEVQMIVDAVLEHYGRLSSDTLVALTHADAPWIEARKGLRPDEASQRPLSTKTMLDFYTAQTLAGRDVPRRKAAVTVADRTAVAGIGREVIERWRTGLDLLAHK